MSTSATRAASPVTSSAPSGGLHIALWLVQGLVAVAFLGAGSMKALTPLDELAQSMSWVSQVPAWMPRLAGVSEILGALGLLLPSVLRVQPRLTPLAAALLTLVMVLAAGLHVALGEPQMVVPALVLGSLSAFVAWGRGVAAPIAAR